MTPYTCVWTTESLLKWLALESPLQKCTPKAVKSHVAVGLWLLSRLSAIKKVDISVVVFSWLSLSGPWPSSVLFVWCSCSSSLLEQAPLVHMLEPIEELSEEEKGNDWFSSKYTGMCFLKTKNIIWYLQYFSLYFSIFVWFEWEHCLCQSPVCYCL